MRKADKINWTFVPARPVGDEPRKQHFFASSIAEWKVDTDPGKLITFFKRERYDFSLWYVPVEVSAEYQINYYAPQVEGAILLGTFKAETKGRTE